MSITALEIINAAFDDVGVRSQGETLEAANAQDGLRRLNNLVLSWSIQSLTIPYVDRQVFSIVANTNTYSIGPGGDFDTDRPASLAGAGLLLNASTPPVEIPRSILTDDQYEAIQIKDLSNSLFTSVYYNLTYQSGFGTIFLWPNPNTALNDLVLYLPKQLSTFSDLSNIYDVPPGYEDALEWNLAKTFIAAYAVKEPTIIQSVMGMATTSLANIKRQNTRMSDMPNAFVWDRRTGYNINTGQGGSY